MQRFALAFGVAALCGLATPAAALTGSAAVDALIGNTVVSNVGGFETARYFKADGSIATMFQGRQLPSRGSWTRSGTDMCEILNGVSICYGLEVNGDDVTYVSHSKDFPAQKAKLLSGNPRNLQ